MIRALVLAAALTVLAACGQKGPLKLPDAPPAKPAPAAPNIPVAPTPPPGTPSSP